jgi:hypothetical protein
MTRRAILARLASGEATSAESKAQSAPAGWQGAGIDPIDRWLAMLRKALEQNYDRLDEVVMAMKTGRRKDMP